MKLFVFHLGEEKKKKSIKIHIAVACMFVEGYKEWLIVNHKNGDKINNKSDNLEWVTYKENSQHAYKTGLAKSQSSKPIKQIDPITRKKIRIFNSVKEAQIFMVGKNGRNISNVANGWHETAYGYKWEFVDN